MLRRTDAPLDAPQILPEVPPRPRVGPEEQAHREARPVPPSPEPLAPQPPLCLVRRGGRHVLRAHPGAVPDARRRAARDPAARQPAGRAAHHALHEPLHDRAAVPRRVLARLARLRRRRHDGRAARLLVGAYRRLDARARRLVARARQTARDRARDARRFARRARVARGPDRVASLGDRAVAPAQAPPPARLEAGYFSATRTPSCNRRIRSARAASAGSWVTIT